MAVADHAVRRVSVWTIGASAPIAVMLQGVSIPIPAVALASDGTVFLANVGNNTITAYAPPYTAAPTVIAAGINNPVALAVDANDDLIVANNSGSNAAIYPPPYTTANPAKLITGPNPVGLVIDGGNHLWIVTSAGALYRYSPPYTPGAYDVVMIQAVSNFQTPSAVAVDAAGRPYVANAAGNTILRFDPPFLSGPPALTISSTPGQPITNPAAVAVAPDGTIVVANSSATGLGLYSATGAPLMTVPGYYNINTVTNNVFAFDADDTMWLAGSLGPPIGFPAPYVMTNSMFLGGAGFFTPNALAIYP
jgi:hypothetical protein